MPIGWAVTVVVLCVAVIVLAVIVLGLLRQVGPALERAAAAGHAHGSRAAPGPPVGQRVPDFTVTGPDGEVSPEQLRGQPVVLLFLSPGCAPCEQLAAEMREAELGDLAARLVVVTEPGGLTGLTLPVNTRILTEPAREVSDPLSVDGTPLAVALDRDGIVKAVRVTNTLKQLTDIAAIEAEPATPGGPG